MLKTMLDPIKIGKLDLRNAIVFPAFQENQSTSEGHVTSKIRQSCLAVARQGVGLIVLEPAYVARQGRAHLRQLGLSQEGHTEGLRRLVKDLHHEGAKVAVRLSHAGAKTSEKICGERPVGPSAFSLGKEYDTCRAFDEGDVEDISLLFVHAAERAEEAGVDMIEIHGAQQHLLDQCLFDSYNTRVDRYGGSMARKIAFATRIIREVKARISPKTPVGFTFSIYDKLDDGLEHEDFKVMIRALAKAKVDFLHPIAIHVLNKFFRDDQTVSEMLGEWTSLPVIVEGSVKSIQIIADLQEQKCVPTGYVLDKSLFAKAHWNAFLERKLHHLQK